MQEPSKVKSNSNFSENAQFPSPPRYRAPFPAVCSSCMSETEKQTTLSCSPGTKGLSCGIVHQTGLLGTSKILSPTQMAKPSQCSAKDQGMMFLIS